MQFSNYPTPPSGKSVISFPKLESWNILTKVATIAAQVNKRRVLCRISQKTLNDKFGETENDPMELVNIHRKKIQEAAKKLIEIEHFEEDGSVLIRGSDM